MIEPFGFPHPALLPLGEEGQRGVLPSGKRLRIEHNGLRQCFLETELESLYRVGRTIRH
jgi:hypothetical protein